MTVRMRGAPCGQHGMEWGRQRGVIAENGKVKRLSEEIASQTEVDLPWAVAKQPQ